MFGAGAGVYVPELTIARLRETEAPDAFDCAETGARERLICGAMQIVAYYGSNSGFVSDSHDVIYMKVAHG